MIRARLREAASLEKHVLLKNLRDALESLRGCVAGRNRDDVEEAIAMVEALAVQFTQREGELIQEKTKVKKLANFLKQFRVIVDAEFVKDNSWPELVPELQSVICNSDLIIEDENTIWETINALTVLHSLIRPFQYFLNPKVAREPVPPQLELIAEKILVPLLPIFHHFVEKALSSQYGTVVKTEKILLIISKCMYFAWNVKTRSWYTKE